MDGESSWLQKVMDKEFVGCSGDDLINDLSVQCVRKIGVVFQFCQARVILE